MCLAEVQSTSQSLTELSLSQLRGRQGSIVLLGIVLVCTYVCMYIAPDYSIQCLVKSKAGKSISYHKDAFNYESSEI